MAWPTVANVISAAARGLGLVAADITNPYASSDNSILQMTQLLTDLGQDLARKCAWSQLQKEHTFNTVNGTATYALPSDFLRFVDGTCWNRGSDARMLGPLSPQQWQAVKGRDTSITSPAAFRVWQDLFYIYTTPSSAEAIYYEYTSSYWVDLLGGTVADADAPTAAADSLFYDKRLLVEGLKMYHRRAKGMGFDPAAFDYLVSEAKGRDGAAPALSLGGSSGPHLIDGCNLPSTGWGS